MNLFEEVCDTWGLPSVLITTLTLTIIRETLFSSLTSQCIPLHFTVHSFL